MPTSRRPSTTSSRNRGAGRTTTGTSAALTEDATLDEESAKRAPLVESAASGSRVAALRDLRDLIAVAITKTDSARDVAALSRQMTDVLEQIELCEKAAPEEKGTPLDELTRRRAGRESGSTHRKHA